MSIDDDADLEEKTYDSFLELLRGVITICHSRTAQDHVARALLLLLLRSANTWRSIRTLRKYTGDDEGFLVDAGCLLRIMFDAYLQAEYIVESASESQERATAYLDFEHVDRYKIEKAATGHNNRFSDRLRNSPKRATGQSRLEAEYERVKEKYLVTRRQPDGQLIRGPRTRSKWYEDDLATIAQKLGKQAEYDIFVRPFHGCIHSSAFAVSRGPMVSGKHVLDLSSTVTARIVRLNVFHHQLKLDYFQQQIMEALCKDYFNA
jgi:hypothetical protein